MSLLGKPKGLGGGCAGGGGEAASIIPQMSQAVLQDFYTEPQVVLRVFLRHGGSFQHSLLQSCNPPKIHEEGFVSVFSLILVFIHSFNFIYYLYLLVDLQATSILPFHSSVISLS